jgi:serine/threonine protein kinase
MSQPSARTVRTERMPYPIEAMWTAATRSGQLSEANRAFENVVRLMTSLILSDVLDLPWGPEVEGLLSGGPDRRGLSRMVLGTRLDLLERLVTLHASAPSSPEVPARVLPPLGAWWQKARPVFALAVQDRNKDYHDASGRAAAIEASFDRLATLLRASRWLADLQLIVVEARERRLGVSRGAIQRLVGPAPFDTLQHRLEASWSSGLSDGLVHVGGRDGRLWVLCPFLGVEGHRLHLLDGITRAGELILADPLEARATAEPTSHPALLPTAEGDLGWHAFLARRLSLAPGYRFEEPRPHALLQLGPPAGEALAPGARIDADHRLVRRLGGGTVADVWEIEDIHGQTRAALKMPRPESLSPEVEARFHREIELLKRLHGAGARRVIGPVERLSLSLDGDTVMALRMPLCAGTLADRLAAARASQTPLPHATLVRWGCEALEALVDLHARGVIHRDIKPSNLFLDTQESVILGDFGLARDLSDDARLTMGPLIPTPRGGPLAARAELAHVAPELRRNPGAVSGKVDIHALAVTLERLASAASPPPGEGLPEPFGSWLRKMTVEDPDARPDAAEVLAAWRAWLRQGEGSRAGILAVGICPLCAAEGQVGAPCGARACAAGGVAFIPPDHAHTALSEAPSSREPLLGTFVDDYLIVGRLGRGSFGRVLLALQRPLFKLRGALKLLDFEAPDAWSRDTVHHYFEREADALSMMTSVNIVRLLKFGDFSGRPYLVMEYVPGGRTVGSEIARAAAEEAALPLDAVSRIVEHTLSGLEAAHAAGLVHRDIKPDNLMLLTEGDDPWFVKLADFGLARLVEGSGRTTAVAGTLHYMAPEQFEQRDYGPWTDLYALAVMTFELLLGQRPFTTERLDAVMAAKRDLAFDPLAAVPDAEVPELLALFLRKALHADPARRYRSARDFREAWRRVVSNLRARGGQTATLTALIELPGPRRRRASHPVLRTARLAPLQLVPGEGRADAAAPRPSADSAAERSSASAPDSSGRSSGSAPGASGPATAPGRVGPPALELGGPTELLPARAVPSALAASSHGVRAPTAAPSGLATPAPSAPTPDGGGVLARPRQDAGRRVVASALAGAAVIGAALWAWVAL